MASLSAESIQVMGKCFEPGNQTGKKCLFMLKWADENVKREDFKMNTKFTIDGPTKPDILWSSVAESEIPDKNCTAAYFVPVKSGKYKLTIKYMGKKIRSDPFQIDVGGPDLDVAKLLSKVTVHGRGYELGKAFTHNEFVVDCSAVQPPIGGIKVHVKGPERASANLQIIDNENGTFRIRYKPTSPGQYLMTVKIAETDIPGSPFNVRVTEFLSS